MWAGEPSASPSKLQPTRPGMEGGDELASPTGCEAGGSGVEGRAVAGALGPGAARLGASPHPADTATSVCAAGGVGVSGWAWRLARLLGDRAMESATGEDVRTLPAPMMPRMEPGRHRGVRRVRLVGPASARDFTPETADGMAAKDRKDLKENGMASYPAEFCSHRAGERSMRQLVSKSVLSVSFVLFVVNSTASSRFTGVSSPA